MSDTGAMIEPNAVDAERAVLGIAMLSADYAADLTRRLKADDFYLPAHAVIYSAISTLADQRQPVDAISVMHQITADGAMRSLPEGPLTLHGLIHDAPATAAFTHHVGLVRDASARRKLARLGTQTQAAANSPATSLTEAAERMREELEQLTAETIDADIKPIGQLLEGLYEEVEKIGKTGGVVGIPTGFPDLDAKLHGFRPGQVILIAGRPGMGKSTLAVDSARNAAFHCGKSVLMFNLEMSTQELLARIVSAQARVELSSLQTGDMSDAEWQRVGQMHGKIADTLLGIDDTSTVTIADIRAKAKAWQRRHGLDLIVIDYLQLMTPVRRLNSREQEVSEISRNVKLLAKELGVPIIALSQLNRGAEQRSDKRPQLSDLRESGSLEQDADVVLMLHRDEVYNPEHRVGEADIIVAKHRGGPTGIVPVVAQLHYSRFVPAAFNLNSGDSGSGTPGEHSGGRIGTDIAAGKDDNGW